MSDKDAVSLGWNGDPNPSALGILGSGARTRLDTDWLLWLGGCEPLLAGGGRTGGVLSSPASSSSASCDCTALSAVLVVVAPGIGPLWPKKALNTELCCQVLIKASCWLESLTEVTMALPALPRKWPSIRASRPGIAPSTAPQAAALSLYVLRALRYPFCGPRRLVGRKYKQGLLCFVQTPHFGLPLSHG
jgi:hypothetical protein